VTLQDFFRSIREQWLVVFAAVIIGLLGAATLFVLRPPEYTARLTMYVSAQGADTTSAAYQGAQLSQDRVASYTALVTSNRICQDVVRQLGLNETPTELARQITASSALNSVLIDVNVTDTSAERSAQLANTVGQAFSRLVSELERPIEVGGSPVVAVRVVESAPIPDRPSSTSLLMTLVAGAFASFAAGLVAALVRGSLDSSVKSLEQLRELSGAPNLGSIAFDPSAAKRPLTVHEEPQSPRSEAFRQLRTNLQFIDIDNPRKVIVVTSAMPSEGKTTTLLNLALALAAAGSRTLVIDADLRRPRVADILEIERTVGLTSVLSGRVALHQATQAWGGGGLDVLASGPLPPNPSELLASAQMRRMIEHLREQYDMILIDSPPLLPVTDAAAMASSTDGAILVCRYKSTSKNELSTAETALSSVNAPLLGTVFSMVPNSGVSAYARYNSYYQSEAQVKTSGLAGDKNGRGFSPAARLTEKADSRQPDASYPET
jgi:polysaccharide biosynthesis transport protein